MIERDSTVLPEPDSPTTPSVRPRLEREATRRRRPGSSPLPSRTSCVGHRRRAEAARAHVDDEPSPSVSTTAVETVTCHSRRSWCPLGPSARHTARRRTGGHFLNEISPRRTVVPTSWLPMFTLSVHGEPGIEGPYQMYIEVLGVEPSGT